MYILFDGRACGGVGAFDAEVLDMDDDLDTLRNDAPDLGGGAIYEYDKDENNLLSNERFIEDVKCNERLM